MFQSRKKKKTSPKRLVAPKGRYVVLAIVLLFLTGGFFILRGGADAATDERIAIEPEGESYRYSGATHRQGTVFTQTFSVNLYWEFYGGGTHLRDTNHVVVELGYIPDQTTPVAGPNGLSIACNDANVTCTPVGPERYDSTGNSYYFNGVSGYARDFAVCVEFNRPFTPANYSSTKPPVFTVTHKMTKTGDFSWVMAQHWYSGTCAAPSDSGHGSVGVIVDGKCTYDPSICTDGDAPGTKDPGVGPTGTGPNGTGQGGGSGGGGSTATTQSDDPNSVPSSTSQGENKQPEIEPSPFFDGKLFAAGSDVLGTVDTVSIGGIKVGYSWFYLGGALAVLGISGFTGWKYRQKLRPVLESVIRTLHLK